MHVIERPNFILMWLPGKKNLSWRSTEIKSNLEKTKSPVAFRVCRHDGLNQPSHATVPTI